MSAAVLSAESPFDRRSYPRDSRFEVWQAPDGWPHRLLRWPAPAGIPPRGSLLFQSGRGDYIEKYLEACDHWHRGGWAIEGFDWRGQGGSGRLRPGAWADDRASFDPLIDDCVAFITDWRQRTPGPHIVVAHSMGGHVALRACAERGLTLDALVLVAPMLRLATGGLPLAIARAVVGSARALGLGGRAAWRDNLENPERYLRLTASLERYQDAQWWKQMVDGLALGPPSWNWIGAALEGGRRLDRPGVLEAVRTPVLLLAAGRDRLVDARAILRAAARLPRGELRCFPTARHELLREIDADRTAALAAIDAFLDLQAPAR